ncbi:Uncharacterised protein [Vibrio cholerae]|nr:Uncharacterised protein [Vibrio cholerae]
MRSLLHFPAHKQKSAKVAPPQVKQTNTGSEHAST